MKSKIKQEIDKILTCSADAQVGEVLRLVEPSRDRPISSYQQMEDAALKLHHTRRSLSAEERQQLDEKLSELDQHDDWNVRRCAIIIRTGK